MVQAAAKSDGSKEGREQDEQGGSEHRDARAAHDEDSDESEGKKGREHEDRRSVNPSVVGKHGEKLEGEKQGNERSEHEDEGRREKKEGAREGATEARQVGEGGVRFVADQRDAEADKVKKVLLSALKLDEEEEHHSAAEREKKTGSQEAGRGDGRRSGDSAGHKSVVVELTDVDTAATEKGRAQRETGLNDV